MPRKTYPETLDSAEVLLLAGWPKQMIEAAKKSTNRKRLSDLRKRYGIAPIKTARRGWVYETQDVMARLPRKHVGKAA